MVSTVNLICLAMKIISLLILFQHTNQASTSEYSNLLARLYKKASASNRPLILIFDKETLRPNQKHSESSKILDVIAKEIDLVDKKAKTLNSLVHKKKRVPKRFQHRSQNLDNILENQFLALLPKKKTKDQGIPRSPVIKSLLRISNELKCEAKDECQDECSAKYSSKQKQNSCNIKCEVKFECDEEKPANSCEDDECADSDECGGGGCTGSTKGWAVTDPVNPCPEC